MIHSSWQMLKELLSDYRKNVGLILVFVVAIPVIELFYLSVRIGGFAGTGMQWSVADCLVFQLDRSFVAFTLIPISLVLLAQLFKHDFQVPFLIRQKSKRSLWQKQIFKTVVTSMLLTTYIIIVTLIIGMLYSTTYINWHSDFSLYFRVNEVVAENIAFGHVIALFFIMSVLLCSLINIIFQFVNWLSNNQLPAWITILIIAGWDLVAIRGQFLIYGRLSIHYKYWYEFWKLITNISFGVGAIIILVIIGTFIAKKRDFLNEAK